MKASQIELIYSQLAELRKDDHYPTKQVESELLGHLFPNDEVDLVTSLSAVTASFYGLLLKHIGNRWGYACLSSVSESIFYEMGKIKAQQALERMPMLPIDSRAFAIVGVFAIYTSSPEYKFSIDLYTEEKTILHVTGIDRYHRISSRLDFADHLKWPATLSFMQGVNDQLGLHARIGYEQTTFTEESESSCRYTFSL